MRCPKPSTTPSASQDHEEPAERRKVPEVGLRLEGLRAGNEGTDPQPEDPRNASGAPPATVSWTGWPTMWPQGGSETLPTSSAAVGQPR